MGPIRGMCPQDAFKIKFKADTLVIILSKFHKNVWIDNFWVIMITDRQTHRRIKTLPSTSLVEVLVLCRGEIMIPHHARFSLTLFEQVSEITVEVVYYNVMSELREWKFKLSLKYFTMITLYSILSEETDHPRDWKLGLWKKGNYSEKHACFKRTSGRTISLAWI